MHLSLRNNIYTKDIAWCVAPAYYRNIMGGRFNAYAAITGVNTSNLPAISPTGLSFRGRNIIGQQFTTSDSTAIGYGYIDAFNGLGSPLYVFTSAGDFTGDYSFLMLGNPPSEGAYRRYLHHGMNGAGSPGNALLMGNFSGASASAVSGMFTSLEFNGSTVTGYADASGALDGKTHCFMSRRLAGLYDVFRDGVNVTTARSSASTTPIGHVSALPAPYTVLGGIAAAENQCANCNIGLIVAWNRGLPDHEMKDLSNDPWLLFYDPPTQVFVRSLAADIFTVGAGQADGVASVIGVPPAEQKGAGQADGVADVIGLSSIPYTSGAGHADGHADVYGNHLPPVSGAAMLPMM